MIYAGPLVAGVVLVFFMVKPLFAPRRQRRNVVEVGREAQPFLYRGRQARQAAPLDRRSGRELQELADKARADLGELPYPFEHSSAAITVGEWALGTVPSARRLGSLYEVASAANDKLIDLYMRIMARVVNAAERAERAVGLEPLPQPKEEELERGGRV